MEERKEDMAFTESYLTNRQVVVIRAEDAGIYTDAASLKDAVSLPSPAPPAKPPLPPT